MCPLFSSTRVKAASAFFTTVAAQPPNVSVSGIAVVEPYGRVARSDRSTRVHLRSVRGNRVRRPTSSVSRSSSHV
jgi:hypothetical protein